MEASLKFQSTAEAEARDRAFERLYRRYARDVYRYTLAVLRNPQEAEDVTQTTFMNAYRAMKRGEQPIKPKHWLIKIAHNACRTRHLRAARRPEEVPFDETQLDLPVPDGDALLVAEVLASLAKLPFNQRAALVMRELEGRSYAEIAETLGMSVAAVEALLYRARRGMRMRTSTVRVLGVVQLPTSLSSFSSGAAAGGVLIGSGLAVKAAVTIAAGLLVGGVGYKTVEATVFKSTSSGLTRLDRPQRAEIFFPASSSHERSASRPTALAGDAPPRARTGSRISLPATAKEGRRRWLPDPAGAPSGSGHGTKGSTPSAGPSGSAQGGGTPSETVKKALDPVPSPSDPQVPAVPQPELPPTPGVPTPVPVPTTDVPVAVPPPPELPDLPAPKLP